MMVMNLNQGKNSIAQKATGLVAEWPNEDVEFTGTLNIDAV